MVKHFHAWHTDRTALIKREATIFIIAFVTKKVRKTLKESIACQIEKTWHLERFFIDKWSNTKRLTSHWNETFETMTYYVPHSGNGGHQVQV